MVVLPTDAKGWEKLEAAQARLLSRVSKACPGTLLAEPEVMACGNDPPAVSHCMECSQWRQAVEGLRAAYGPNPE